MGLIEYLRSCEKKPFEPGVHDCALFAADVILSQTGYDPAAAYRGKYSTLEEGFELIQKDGFKTHLDLADSLMARIHPSHAETGDIVAVPGDGGSSLGVLTGAHVRVLLPAGLAVLPRRRILAAWSLKTLEK